MDPKTKELLTALEMLDKKLREVIEHLETHEKSRALQQYLAEESNLQELELDFQSLSAALTSRLN